MKTEELKIRVKELNDYFVGKLVNGEYDIKDSDKYSVMVNVDGYRFNIWIANGSSKVQTYGQGFNTNLMELVFSKDQKSTIYKNLMSEESRIALMEEIENKEKEIERLKSILNKI